MSDVDKLNVLSLADFNTPSSLIYGIGNVGRQDDGLGWAFIDWLENESLCLQAEMVRNYQLFLEDADLISSKERVLFVDATQDTSVEAFSLTYESAAMDFSFTSHAISIPVVMAVCQQCFETLPEVYVLAIKGYEWELQEGLTLRAMQNMQSTITYFRKQQEAALQSQHRCLHP